MASFAPVKQEAKTPQPGYGEARTIRRLPGAVGFGRTLSWKVRLALPVPSPTVIVMFAIPVWLGSGVTVTVRLLPAPPKTMSVFRTSDRLDELAARDRLDTLVSLSPMVKGIGAVAESMTMTWSVIGEMVGN